MVTTTTEKSNEYALAIPSGMDLIRNFNGGID